MGKRAGTVKLVSEPEEEGHNPRPGDTLAWPGPPEELPPENPLITVDYAPGVC